MRTVKCENCGTDGHSMNSTVRVADVLYCESCLEQTYPERKVAQGTKVERPLDPTICNSCETDFGDTELAKAGPYPLCVPCLKALRNKTFPMWVKAFFAAILAIVMFGFIWNWRYYRAYQELNESGELFAQGDYKGAASRMALASDDVPEVEDLKTLRSYYTGFALLSEENGAEALPYFLACSGKMPESYKVELCIQQGIMDKSFKEKRYRDLLAAAKKTSAFLPKDAWALAAISSAFAAVYAQEGQTSDRDSSLIYLQRAHEIDSTSSGQKEYEERIHHRLATREVITQKEFKKRFPGGWKPKQ